MENYDVVVVGGGLAGVVASRELKNCGLNAVLLEARDRLGGRTYTSTFNDTKVEMGGAWVNWNQAHIWSEVTRYGLTLMESGVYSEEQHRTHVISGMDLTGEYNKEERVGWIYDNDVVLEEPKVIFKKLNDAMDLLCEGSYEHITRPHDLFFRDLSYMESMTVREKLDQLDIDPKTKAFVDGILTTITNYPLDKCSLLSVARWYALCGYVPDLVWDTEERYKIREGISTLVEKIAADGGEIRLSSPVKSIEQSDDNVIVTTQDGAQFQAKKVIVAMPQNVLHDVEFTPPLSDMKQQAFEEGPSAGGFKLWAKVRGLHAYVGVAPEEYPLNFLGTEFHVDGNTLCYAFGNDAKAFNVEDRAEVEAEIRKVLPGAEVMEVYAQDWVHDEYSQGTWAMPPKGHIQKYITEMQRPEGHVHLAGADFAKGWYGFMDGALESGLDNARQVIRALKGE